MYAFDFAISITAAPQSHPFASIRPFLFLVIKIASANRIIFEIEAFTLPNEIHGSNNISYNLQPNGRFYKLGSEQIEIPSKVINTLKIWNQQEDKMGADYDKRVAIALLLVCVNAKDLLNSMVSEDVKNFISGMQIC